MIDYKERIEKTLNGLNKTRLFWEEKSKKHGNGAYEAIIISLWQKEELLRNILDDFIWNSEKLEQIEYKPLD